MFYFHKILFLVRGMRGKSVRLEPVWNLSGTCLFRCFDVSGASLNSSSRWLFSVLLPLRELSFLFNYDGVCWQYRNLSRAVSHLPDRGIKKNQRWHAEIRTRSDDKKCLKNLDIPSRELKQKEPLLDIFRAIINRFPIMIRSFTMTMSFLWGRSQFLLKSDSTFEER